MRIQLQWAVSSFIVACAIAAGPTAARAVTVDNQKTTVALTANVILANNVNHFVTLARGMSKRMVVVTASITATPDTDAQIFMFLIANGVGIEPGTPTGVSSACASGAQCTFSYTWWIDIDAEEAANPGEFVGKPIELNLAVAANGGGTGPGVLSLVAHMVKK